jgi:hypothetical protein
MKQLTIFELIPLTEEEQKQQRYKYFGTTGRW